MPPPLSGRRYIRGRQRAHGLASSKCIIQWPIFTKLCCFVLQLVCFLQMPRYEKEERSHRRPSSHSPLPDEDISSRRSHRDHTGSKYDRSMRTESGRRSRSPHRSSRKERTHRSSSRNPYDEQKRRRDRSGDRTRTRDREGHYRKRRHRSPPPSESPPRRQSRHAHRDDSVLKPRNASPQSSRRSRKPLPSQQDAYSGTPREISETSTPAEKQQPNFSNTGKLAAESKTVTTGDGSSIVLKYHEPPEARKPPPKEPWRLYIFKGEDLLENVELSGRSCWLVGREKLVADLPIEHPSCSKQHAALQFRYVEKKNEYGDRDGRVRPYLIDLESANGSIVNGEPAPKGRYMELMDKDVLKFGLSTREYVLMLPPG